MYKTTKLKFKQMVDQNAYDISNKTSKGLALLRKYYFSTFTVLAQCHLTQINSRALASIATVRGRSLQKFTP